MIKGVITTRDIFIHGFTIARSFGALAFLRCCVALLKPQADHFSHLHLPCGLDALTGALTVPRTSLR